MGINDDGSLRIASANREQHEGTMWKCTSKLWTNPSADIVVKIHCISPQKFGELEAGYVRSITRLKSPFFSQIVKCKFAPTT